MKITAETLRQHRACKEGIEAFMVVYPDGLNLRLWTRAEQIRVLKTPLGVLRRAP